MDKTEILQAYQAYQSVLSQWIAFLLKHHFYMEKNEEFFDKARSALQNIPAEIQALQELPESSVQAIYPGIEKDIGAMRSFIQNYPPPEE